MKGNLKNRRWTPKVSGFVIWCLMLGVLLSPLAAHGAFCQVNNNDSFKIPTIFGKCQDASNKNQPATTTTFGDLITLILEIALLVSASVAVIFLVYGGFVYVTAHGNEEKTESAKKTMKSAMLGLVIIILSFAFIAIIANILIRGEPGTGLKKEAKQQGGGFEEF